MGSPLKGKNLLPREQILSLRVTHRYMGCNYFLSELFPLKVYLFQLIQKTLIKTTEDGL